MKIDPLDWFTDYVTQARAEVAEEVGDGYAPTVIAFVRQGTPCAVALCKGNDEVGYELTRIGAGAFDADEVLVCFDAWLTTSDDVSDVAPEMQGEMSKMTLGPKGKGDGIDTLMIVKACREGDLGLWIHPYKVNLEQREITFGDGQDVGALGFLGGPGADRFRGAWNTTSFEEFMQDKAQLIQNKNLTRLELDAIVQSMLPQVFACQIELIRERPPEPNLN